MKSIKEIREEKRMTQVELARLAGVGQNTISDLETGDIKRPSWEVVARLARALEISPEELFPVPEPETKTA